MHFFFQHLTAIQEICFYTSFALSGLLIISKKKAFSFATPLNLPIALFFVWACIGLFFALDKTNSFHDILAHFIKYMIFFFIIINYFNSQAKFVLLAWMIVLAAALFCFGGIIYFYLILGHPWTDRFFLIDGQFIPYIDFLLAFSTILAISLSLAEKRTGMKCLLYFCLFVIGSAVMLAQTRSAILAIVLASVLLLHQNKKAILALAMVLIVFCLIFPIRARFGDMQNLLHNERIWNVRIFEEIVKDYPVTGIGFGMQTYDNVKLLEYYNSRLPEQSRVPYLIASPHNTLLEIAVRTGLIGLFFYLSILFVLIKMGWTLIKKGKSDFTKRWGLCILSAFIVFFIQAMFSDTSFGRQAIVFYMILGMMTILWRTNKSKSEAWLSA